MPYKKTYVDNSGIHGKGLFAKTPIKKATYLGEYTGPEITCDENNGMHVLWAQMEDGAWIGRDGKNKLRFLNHSDAPSCEFEGFELYAIRHINADEELTIDYGYNPAEHDEG